jgi:cytochrome c-type biogenesis protein CcmE
MSPKQKRRLILASLLVGGIGGALALALTAFRENILFFYSPSEVVAGKVPAQAAFRLGGLVTTGSLKREADGLTVRFTVTDTAQSVPVRFRGILPDLFREGQGVVAHGRLSGDVFDADEVLAKHDENYMPPEAADAVKKAQMQKARAPGGPMTGGATK